MVATIIPCARATLIQKASDTCMSRARRNKQTDQRSKRLRGGRRLHTAAPASLDRCFCCNLLSSIPVNQLSLPRHNTCMHACQECDCIARATERADLVYFLAFKFNEAVLGIQHQQCMRAAGTLDASRQMSLALSVAESYIAVRCLAPQADLMWRFLLRLYLRCPPSTSTLNANRHYQRSERTKDEDYEDHEPKSFDPEEHLANHELPRWWRYPGTIPLWTDMSFDVCPR